MNNPLISTAIRAAFEAGKEILDVYSRPIAVEQKDDKSPLTEADRRGHLRIVSFLKDTDLPILSEEGKSIPYAERKGWARFWMVDPLDGTKEFIKRNGEFTVNIALIEDGRATQGVIYVPVMDVMYVGVVGQGAWKIEAFSKVGDADLTTLLSNGKKLPENKGRTTFSMVGSRSHMSDETMAYYERIKALHGEVEMVSMGSSLKICLVADGTADAYPRFAPTMEWDTAAGQAIAEAAGCTVTLPDEVTPVRYNKEDLLNPWFLVRRSA